MSLFENFRFSHPGKVRDWTGYFLKFLFAACLLFVLTNYQDHLIAQESKATDPGDQSLPIEKLIAQLGDSDYILRTQAEAELQKLGDKSIPYLRAALTQKTSDNEIRLRARRLLIRVEREVQAKKTKDFLEGKEVSSGFAGWEEFSKVAGDDKNARQLFIKIHKAQPKLLKASCAAFPTSESTENFLQPVEEEFAIFAKKIYLSSNGNATRLISNLVVALFVAGKKYHLSEDSPATRLKVSEDNSMRIFRVLAQPQMITTINSSGNKKVILTLISRWLESTPNNPSRLMANKITVIQKYRLESMIDSVIDFTLDTEGPIRIRANGIAMVSQIGRTKDSKKLSALFDDRGTVGRFLPMKPKATKSKSKKSTEPKQLYEVQIRDLALATVILLNNKNLEDFGFLGTAQEKDGVLYTQAGFASNEIREAAFKKWDSVASSNSTE